MHKRSHLFGLGLLLLASASAEAQQLGRPPRFDHVVVVIEENHSFDDVIGKASAPFINKVAASGALFTNAHGDQHPSQPNYLDLFAGGNQGVQNDSCPHTLSGPNLAASLLAAGRSFAGYSGDLPRAGYTGCATGSYRRKHNPWVNFTNVPARVNLPMSAFPSDYRKLPAVSFVVPGIATDMHSGSVEAADTWLRTHMAGYLGWAASHNSLLIITWDESNDVLGNQIPLVMAGAHVRRGRYGERVDHFTVLRTIEEIFGLAPIGQSAAAKAILNIWN